MYAKARLGFPTNSVMYESTSARFTFPRRDFLKYAAKLFAVYGMPMVIMLGMPRGKMRALGSVTATRKSGVVCLLAGSYLKWG